MFPCHFTFLKADCISVLMIPSFIFKARSIASSSLSLTFLLASLFYEDVTILGTYSLHRSSIVSSPFQNCNCITKSLLPSAVIYSQVPGITVIQTWTSLGVITPLIKVGFLSFWSGDNSLRNSSLFGNSSLFTLFIWTLRELSCSYVTFSPITVL